MKFIQIEDEALAHLIQLHEETGHDMNLLVNAALNCLTVYFDNELVKTLIDSHYKE